VGNGDVGPRSDTPIEVLESRRLSVAPGRWRWLNQLHGDLVVALSPNEACTGRGGDALVTSVPGAPVAVFAADCALVGLASPEGLVGAVHAGWRGLLAGVLERTATVMRAAGATELKAVVGACIGPECYEFSASELEPIQARYGPSVRSETAAGRLALDLRAGVHRALEQAAVSIAAEVSECTACDPGWFSWRARSETGRHALLVAGSP